MVSRLLAAPFQSGAEQSKELMGHILFIVVWAEEGPCYSMPYGSKIEAALRQMDCMPLDLERVTLSNSSNSFSKTICCRSSRLRPSMLQPRSAHYRWWMGMWRPGIQGWERRPVNLTRWHGKSFNNKIAATVPLAIEPELQRPYQLLCAHWPDTF